MHACLYSATRCYTGHQAGTAGKRTRCRGNISYVSIWAFCLSWSRHMHVHGPQLEGTRDTYRRAMPLCEVVRGREHRLSWEIARVHQRMPLRGPQLTREQGRGETKNSYFHALRGFLPPSKSKAARDVKGLMTPSTRLRRWQEFQHRNP